MGNLRGFPIKKESQGVKNYLTGGHQPWLPGEIAIIESNVMLELGELCEVFEKAGFTRSRQSIGKKRLAMTRKMLKAKEIYDNIPEKPEENKMATPVQEETNVATGEPIRKLSEAELEEAKGRAQSDVAQPLVGAKREPIPFDFVVALALLKNGARVSRTGWNDHHMFIYLVDGSEFEVNRPPLLGIYPEGTKIKYLPHIDMKTADGSCVPWIASQTDLLSSDWCRFND